MSPRRQRIVVWREGSEAMGRLRRRLDGLESHAHQTMSGADALLAAARDLVQDLSDGVKVEVEVFGRKIPLVVKIDPREE